MTVACPNHPDADLHSDGEYVTLLGWEPHVVDGVRHSHDANKRKGGWFCREGCLVITESVPHCPADGCDYGYGPDVVEVVEGRGREIMDSKHVGFVRDSTLNSQNDPTIPNPQLEVEGSTGVP